MAKLIIAIEKSMEQDRVGGFSDILSAVSFLAMITAGLSWLLL